MQEKLGDPEANRAVSATCFAGLCDTAVPVRIGQKLIGFLQTGQVSLQPLTTDRFQKITQKLIEWGANVDLRRLEEAYFHSQVLTPKQYAGLVGMLEVFATHLGTVGNQLVIQESLEESPFTKQAKAYVSEHQDNEISLDEMARTLHVSTFYFCKMFKKGTGLSFTDYLGRVRIERAKTLLLDPNRRVSEVAYEVGFGSLTHFNRLFSRIVGKSPTEFRESLPQ
jgi:YesN/AraC family two-component response regulator